MVQAQWKMDSKIGPLYLVASKLGLEGVFWERQAAPMTASLEKTGAEQLILLQAAQELEEYFSGRRKIFDVPVAIRGSPFQQQVWNQLRLIPYGETRSYREIASLIQNEKAARAVGAANGRNPLCIIIPCHRVVAANGSLGGYSGGLEKKSQLLEFERSQSF